MALSFLRWWWAGRPAGARWGEGRPARRTRLGVERLEDRLAPAVFPVTNLNDTGTGSLRAALALANADSTTADTIVFDPTLAGGTVRLRSVGDGSAGPSALAVTTPVTIAGTGQTIIQVGAIPMRLFYVAYPGRLTLQNLALTRGQARGGSSDFGGGAAGLGGAVFNNQGQLTLDSCTLTGNEAIGGFFGFPVADWCFGTHHQPQQLLLDGRKATAKDFAVRLPRSFIRWLDRWVRQREARLQRDPG